MINLEYRSTKNISLRWESKHPPKADTIPIRNPNQRRNILGPERGNTNNRPTHRYLHRHLLYHMHIMHPHNRAIFVADAAGVVKEAEENPLIHSLHPVNDNSQMSVTTPIRADQPNSPLTWIFPTPQGRGTMTSIKGGEPQKTPNIDPPEGKKTLSVSPRKSKKSRLLNKDTPVGGRLKGFVHQWEQLGAHQHQITLIREGYSLPFRTQPRLPRTPLVVTKTATNTMHCRLLYKTCFKREP